MFIKRGTGVWGVLDLLNCVHIHARLDCFSRSITMEALRHPRYKKGKIHPIKHTPESKGGEGLVVNYSHEIYDILFDTIKKPVVIILLEWVVLRNTIF